MSVNVDELYDELEDFHTPQQAAGQGSAREERIAAGFEDIVRFYEERGRLPTQAEGADIFERLYAVRLRRIGADAECRAVAEPLDRHGLLERVSESGADLSAADIDSDKLLEEVADFAEVESDITELRHVSAHGSGDKAVPDLVAQRRLCHDFARFEPLFAKVQEELRTGQRQSRRFKRDATILKGQFFIVDGQKAYVAEVGELVRTPSGRPDARLRVIYDNGTESNLLMRSLQKALQQDEAGRRITDAELGPLFSGETGAAAAPPCAEKASADPAYSGTIYVLRSELDHPYINANRELIHKIGVTTGSVAKRIANAAQQATYLLAEVEVVATYRLSNINSKGLEALIHRVLAPAQLQITIPDRFGKPVIPREWFLVPLSVIDEVVQRIKDGSITGYRYDPQAGELRRVTQG